MRDTAGLANLRYAGAALLSFLFPDTCVACGAPLAARDRHVCPACRLEVEGKAPLRARLADTGTDLRVHFVLPFEGVTRSLVHALKYDARTSVASTLAQVALPATRGVAEDGRADAVVPVPLHSLRMRERGFNQAELIARNLAGSLGLPLCAGLSRTRSTPPRTALSKRERLESIELAFEARPALAGKRILLLDDVVTTGATLVAAARASLHGGAESVVAMAIAAQAPPDR